MAELAAREQAIADEVQDLRREQFNLRVDNGNLSRQATHAKKDAQAWVCAGVGEWRWWMPC